jgi:hypothetical protein
VYGSTFALSAGHVLSAVWELAGQVLRFGWESLLPKVVLAGRAVAPESQLAVELKGSGREDEQRHQFTPAVRILWVALSKLLHGLEKVVCLMKPRCHSGHQDGVSRENRRL